MKKVFSIFFTFCIITSCLFGCTKEPAASKNEIAAKVLTQEQTDIVNLLSNDKQEILLYDYKTEEAYKSAEFWAEIYENGVLIDRLGNIKSFKDAAEPRDGQLAILITRNSDFQWAFTTSENGTQISNTDEFANVNDDTLGRAYGSIDEPVTIEDGKEIVLYTSIFSNNGILLYSDQQIYIEQPELINEYPYVHIIKCKFEK